MSEGQDTGEVLTVRRALALGIARLREAGIESAQLDMSLLLAEAIGAPRLAIYTDPERPLSEEERLRARGMLARRLRHEPVAYILGRREFYGLEFEVTGEVLIPRPETEHLVERALAWIAEEAETRPAPVVADIGTGSGAIAVAVAVKAKTARVIAVDCSPAALAVARRNVANHEMADRIDFREGDLLAPLAEPVDAILSNPPYIAEGERVDLPPDVIRHEPHLALFAGPDGLDTIRRLIADAPIHLSPGGLLLMECGQGQAGAIIQLIAADPRYAAHAIHRDYAGIERVIEARRA